MNHFHERKRPPDLGNVLARPVDHDRRTCGHPLRDLAAHAVAISVRSPVQREGAVLQAFLELCFADCDMVFASRVRRPGNGAPREPHFSLGGEIVPGPCEQTVFSGARGTHQVNQSPGSMRVPAQLGAMDDSERCPGGRFLGDADRIDGKRRLAQGREANGCFSPMSLDGQFGNAEQPARQGKVEAERFQHVRIAPSREVRLLQRGQASAVAAGDLGLRGRRAEVLEVPHARGGNRIQSRFGCSRHQRQKIVHAREHQPGHFERGVRSAVPVEYVDQLVQAHAWRESERGL